uniref:Galectin n=1 Tax=Varanus komodoensis TaxID=61221 RepID=A0A8D2IYT9_VARKO
VKGKVRSDAGCIFKIKVGQDASNLILLLRFQCVCHAGFNTKVIEMNSMADGELGEMVHKLAFPFRQGEEARVSMESCVAQASVSLLAESLTFPNQLGLESAEFLSVEGDFKIRAIKFY